jgi:hypothetical protein
MSTPLAGLRLLALATVVLAGVAALAGSLVAHFAGLGSAVQGAGWGMCVGGGLVALLVGQSGSPTRTSVEGRWGPFGQYWGGNAPLPESPLWLAFVGAVVFAGGIAIVVLA